MPDPPNYPGVSIDETPSGARDIPGVPTARTAFIGTAPEGPVGVPAAIHTFSDYERQFGGLNASSTMSLPERDFYANGGSQAIIVRIMGAAGGAPGVNDYIGSDTLKTGIFALDHADLFNLLCIPPPSR